MYLAGLLQDVAEVRESGRFLQERQELWKVLQTIIFLEGGLFYNFKKKVAIITLRRRIIKQR